jgi:pimeloyl-ACP methyl ester carboxylesterase
MVIVPVAFEYRPYYLIASQLACSPKAYTFGYDWRRLPQENAEDLGNLVNRVSKETGEKPSIIGHSMGGLITHYYLKNHAAAVDKVVYVGVPFQPGIGFLDDLNNGSSVGLNKTILSKKAVFSHPSSFALLPHKGQKLYEEQDLMDVETWKKNQLSVFKDFQPDIGAFTHTLQQIQNFHAQLDSPTRLDNQFLFVVSDCTQTPHSQTDGIIGKEPGDGRVSKSSSFPVEFDNLDKEVFNSCAAHDQQLNTKEILTKIFEFLNH